MHRIGYLAAIVATALSFTAFVAGARADLTGTDIYPEGQGKVGSGPGCEVGHGCAWDAPFFVVFFYKWKIPNDYGYYHLKYGPARSAKNRFNDRKLVLLRGDGTVVGCLNPPYGDRPDPGPFGWVKVGGLGSRC